MYGRKDSLYDILEVPRDAKVTDIVRAYRKLRSQMMEETAPPDPRRSALLHEAYEVLSDPDRRAAYDRSLASPGLAAPAGGTSAKPKWVGVFAGVVILTAALYFTLNRPGTSPPAARAPQEIIDAASFAVGRVQSIDLSGRAAQVGLAVAIDEGVMVTTCHGLAPGAQLVVALEARTPAARVSMADEELDLCKLAVDGAGSRPLPIGTEPPRAGDKVYAVRADGAAKFALLAGTVKQLRNSPKGRVIEVTIPIAPTASGGPLLDANGRLVGITTAPHAFGDASHIALPAAWIKEARSRGKAK